MKHTFKYLASFAAFFVAALLSGFTVSAQNLDDGTYLVDNGIAYAKKATLNDDGTYTIDLETFVTGEVTQTFESVPVDVVLVLDVSGSMNGTISTVSSYEPANVSSLTYNNRNDQPTLYYYYNGAYRQISVVRNWEYFSLFNQGWRYTISFQANGRTYYINNSGQVVTDRPTNVDGANTNLLASNVQLYEIVTTTTTKMDALKDAVEAFIQEIAHNDWYEDDDDEDDTNDKKRTEALGNRISIVKFADDSYYNYTSPSGTNPATDPNAPITEGNHFTGSYNRTEVLKSFTATSTDANVNDLIAAVDGMTAGGATAADYGMNLARLLINTAVSDPARANSNKTVVFFTDGEPNHQNGFDTGVATAAISNSKLIKDVTYGTDATHPSVFAVGVFDTKPTAGGNLENFMNYVSSNYPGATAYNNGGTQASSSFYMDASGGTAEDLKAIFTAIAHAAGGSGNTDVSGGSSVTVDIVSSSFSVPQGFEDHPENAVTVLVAPCNSITTIGNKDYLHFGEAKAPGEYGLPDITPSISEADNKISTTGFDYSENWCGPDPTSTSEVHNYAYHGYKQIIRFVITVKDDAVGGPAVETNDSESGIYLEGATEPLIRFNRPTVKLPVQIWIQKNGLQGEDSAVFTLARAPFSEDFDPEEADWESVTKIVVGPDDYDPSTGVYLKKQVGLNPDYFYRIKEDAWAFGYQYQYGGVLYTVGDEVVNPFVFNNTPTNKKFDEATARNIFNEKTQ